MIEIQRLELRSSEIRSRLADLGGKQELTDEERQEMDALGREYQTNEARHRALVIAGDVPPPAIETRNDPQGRELRALLTRANMGAMLSNIAEKRNHEGAEKEVQELYGLSGGAIPLAMLRSFDGGALETRAATAIPSDVNTEQHESLRYVFPSSAHAHLGIMPETVGVGDAVYPILTSILNVQTPDRLAAATETDGIFTAEVISPQRLQAAMSYAREDKARFMSLDSDLRENLAAGLSDGLDREIIQGTTNGLLGTAGLTVRAGDAAAEAVFSTYRGLLFDAGTIDGRYAGMADGIRMLFGPAAYAHCGGVYRTANSDTSALENLMSNSGGVMASANIPAPDANDQDVLISKMMSRRAYVSAMWESIDIIYDETTFSSTGVIQLTAVMLFGNRLIDADAFVRRAIQVA